MRQAPSRPWRSAGTAHDAIHLTRSCVAPTAAFFHRPGVASASGAAELGFAGVFRSGPQGQVHRATDACAYPNGLAFLP